MAQGKVNQAGAARPDTWKLPKDIDTPDLDAAAALDAC
jgi:hypothetical protein